jgi:hypothetical protein
LKALAVDKEADLELHPLALQHGHLEIYILYMARNAENPVVIPDGTHLTTSTVCLLPTSRGSI